MRAWNVGHARAGSRHGPGMRARAHRVARHPGRNSARMRAWRRPGHGAQMRRGGHGIARNLHLRRSRHSRSSRRWRGRSRYRRGADALFSAQGHFTYARGIQNACELAWARTRWRGRRGWRGALIHLRRGACSGPGRRSTSRLRHLVSRSIGRRSSVCSGIGRLVKRGKDIGQSSRSCAGCRIDRRRRRGRSGLRGGRGGRRIQPAQQLRNTVPGPGLSHVRKRQILCLPAHDRFMNRWSLGCRELAHIKSASVGLRLQIFVESRAGGC